MSEMLFHRSSIDYEYNVTKWTTPVVARSKACVWGQLACSCCGFESRRGRGYLTLVSVVCYQVTGLCVGFIAHPEESYRVWCVECVHEASLMRL